MCMCRNLTLEAACSSALDTQYGAAAAAIIRSRLMEHPARLTINKLWESKVRGELHGSSCWCLLWWLQLAGLTCTAACTMLLQVGIFVRNRPSHKLLYTITITQLPALLSEGGWSGPFLALLCACGLA